MKKSLALLSLLASFTTFLFAQPDDPDCIVCQEVCVDLTATASDLPAGACAGDGFEYQLDITGLGADIASYHIYTFDNNGLSIDFETHGSNSPTTLFPFISPVIQGCEPADQTFTYEIQCPDDGSILASGTIGIVTIYPSPFNFFPNITPSIACVQDLVITPDICGTIVLDPDPMPVPGCGGIDTEVNWSVDFGFEYPPNCYSFPIEGTETVFACDGTPGDPCDDNSPCTANDTLDENCSCVGEGPTAMINNELPVVACVNEIITINVTVDMDPGPDGILISISNQFGFTLNFTQIFPGDPLTLDIDIFTFIMNPCDSYESELILEILCPVTSAIIGDEVLIGTVTVYPDPNYFVPNIEPAIACEEEPVIEVGVCGTLTTSITPADPIACPTGTDGFVEWTIDTGFDTINAPDCFSNVALSGQEPIIACSNCCPLVIDVAVADAGPFCNGDMTEVCATFDATFETDDQTSINGVDAIAGENQICFQLNLVNDGCSFEPAQIPFEIICNDDGTTNNALTSGVLVAPDPANFQYQVLAGSCNTPPVVAPPSGIQQPCLVFSNGATIITEPVDGCPPIEGEVEVGIDYLDNNSNPIDLTAFTCDGFPASIILPQPGCSSCPCPNVPVSVTLSEDICEGNMAELCFEFQPGDEANAVGTEITIGGGGSGTYATFTIGGDGTSATHCVEFSSALNVECEPAAETLNLDLYCGADGSVILDGIISVTVFPSLNKFSYEIIPAIDNCPNAPVYPQIINTGECELDIFDVVTVDPVDGCPPTPGSITYSVNYINPIPFTLLDVPNECLFTEVINAVEPIPACDTCACEDEISGAVIPPMGCSVAGINVTIYDATGNTITTLTTDANGVYDSSPTVYPCGDYLAELTDNIPPCYTDANGETGPKTFTIDDDSNNDDTDGTDFIAEEPQPCNISAEITEIVCDDNETPQDGSDDVVTIIITITSTGSWTAGDGTMGNDGDTYSFPATLANNSVTMMFSVDGEVDCETVFTSIVNNCDGVNIPTLSQWGLIVLCLLVMSLGAIKIVNQRLRENLRKA